jgi:hypothetical protein
MAERVRSAVVAPNQWTHASLEAYRDRAFHTDALVQPWLQLADESYLDVSRLANENPELMIYNTVLANAVYDSRLERAASIATR